MTVKLKFPDADDLIQRYLSGTSLKQLSDERGVSRRALDRLFKDRHVPVRGRSAAEYLKWVTLKQNRALVERQCTGAWKASRGRVQGFDEKVRRAKTVHGTLINIGKHVVEIMDALRVLGIPSTPNSREGIYNIDIALRKSRVAVEVQTAYLTGGKSTSRERIEYLFDHGWTVLIISTVNGLKDLDYGRLAQHIITFQQRASSHPAAWGQYGVIGSHAKPVAFKAFDFDHWTRIAGF